METAAEYIVAFCDGGYTTNLPLEDVLDGKAWVVDSYDGQPLAPEHGGPARRPPALRGRPALVVRCPSCTGVVLRYASDSRGLRFEMTGTRLLTVTAPPD